MKMCPTLGHIISFTRSTFSHSRALTRGRTQVTQNLSTQISFAGGAGGTESLAAIAGNVSVAGTLLKLFVRVVPN